MVFVYNNIQQECLKRQEVPVLIENELDALVIRGARNIAVNPLYHQDDNGQKTGGKPADDILEHAILKWLETKDNSDKVDAVYIIDKMPDYD